MGYLELLLLVLKLLLAVQAARRILGKRKRLHRRK
jgi:hypothetical protein